MRITDYELFAVPPRWLLLKLETSDGVVGWGEPIVQGRLRTVESAVEELIETYLFGKDPLRIESHWQTMYRAGYYRGGPVLMSAMAGIDQALWDIKGKHYGAPIHDLLGGATRDRMQVHQWVGGENPDEVATSAREMVDAGYKAVKMNAKGEFFPIETPSAVDRVRQRVKAVREEVGPDIGIGIDFHGRVSKPMARRLIAAVDPYEPMFIDQPVLPEHNDALDEIARMTTTPLATGERLYSRWDFKQVLIDGNISVLQPDVSHVGGISELKRVAAMAEAFDTVLVPHCPLSPVAFAACLQVGFSTQNVVMQEQSLSLHDPENSTGLKYITDPDVFTFSDGAVERPTGPGLGIDVDEDYVREQAQYDVVWHNPLWHHDDGSIAEW